MRARAALPLLAVVAALLDARLDVPGNSTGATPQPAILITPGFGVNKLLPEVVANATFLVGTVGGSYGGGIQLDLAETDDRIRAIVAGRTWNPLQYSLAPNNRLRRATRPASRTRSTSRACSRSSGPRCSSPAATPTPPPAPAPVRRTSSPPVTRRGRRPALPGHPITVTTGAGSTFDLPGVLIAPVAVAVPPTVDPVSAPPARPRLAATGAWR